MALIKKQTRKLYRWLVFVFGVIVFFTLNLFGNEGGNNVGKSGTNLSLLSQKADFVFGGAVSVAHADTPGCDSGCGDGGGDSGGGGSSGGGSPGGGSYSNGGCANGGASGDGSSGGGGGGCVICTELHNQKLISDSHYFADSKFGETLPLHVRQGYWLWAMPLVSIMRRSKLITALVYLCALPAIKEMAYRGDGMGEGSFIGAFLLNTGIPVCRALGRTMHYALSLRSQYVEVRTTQSS